MNNLKFTKAKPWQVIIGLLEQQSHPHLSRFTMIKRTQWQHRIQTALQRSRILILVGPRQCGKTTLAREFVSEDSVNYFDLEDPVSLARLDEPNILGLFCISSIMVIRVLPNHLKIFVV